MPKERVCANNLALSRRSLLAGGTAAGAALAFPANATPATESPLWPVFDRWMKLRDFLNSPITFEGPEFDAAYQEMLRCEEIASCYTPVTLACLQLKIIFADEDGDMSSSIHQVRLVRNAYKAIGSAHLAPVSDYFTIL